MQLMDDDYLAWLMGDDWVLLWRFQCMCSAFGELAKRTISRHTPTALDYHPNCYCYYCYCSCAMLQSCPHWCTQFARSVESWLWLNTFVMRPTGQFGRCRRRCRSTMTKRRLLDRWRSTMLTMLPSSRRECLSRRCWSSVDYRSRQRVRRQSMCRWYHEFSSERDRNVQLWMEKRRKSVS